MRVYHNETLMGNKESEIVLNFTEKKKKSRVENTKEADWLVWRLRILRGKNKERTRQLYYPQLPARCPHHACAEANGGKGRGNK